MLQLAPSVHPATHAFHSWPRSSVDRTATTGTTRCGDSNATLANQARVSAWAGVAKPSAQRISSQPVPRRPARRSVRIAVGLAGDAAPLVPGHGHDREHGIDAAGFRE